MQPANGVFFVTSRALMALFVLSLACGVPSAASQVAQTAPKVETLPGEDPAVVARWVEHMRNNMTLGRYPDGTPLRPEPPEERAKPIIPADLAQIAYERGVLSGMLEVCGSDWEIISFKPLMADMTARGDLSPKQLGFIALLHGAAQEQGRNGTPEEECTAELKASLSATLVLSKQISQKFAKAG